MTNQEAYDKVCHHLATQKRPSLDEKGYCMYRSGTGLKCAIGALIPDEEYHHDMEHGSMYSICDYDNKEEDVIDGYNEGGWTTEYNKEHCSLSGLNIGLLASLQTLHDRGRYTAIKVREELQKIATKYGLDSTKAELVQEWYYPTREEQQN